MTDFKEYIAKQIVGQTLRFKCDCVMKLDFTGVVRDYTMNGDEILYEVESDGKIITIGSNTPDMRVSLKDSI